MDKKRRDEIREDLQAYCACDEERLCMHHEAMGVDLLIQAKELLAALDEAEKESARTRNAIRLVASELDNEFPAYPEDVIRDARKILLQQVRGV